MGTIVVLAANSIPSINDITIQELEPLLHQAGHFDSAFGAALSIGRLRAVGSGSGLPVIDLSQVMLQICHIYCDRHACCGAVAVAVPDRAWKRSQGHCSRTAIAAGWHALAPQ